MFSASDPSLDPLSEQLSPIPASSTSRLILLLLGCDGDCFVEGSNRGEGSAAREFFLNIRRFWFWPREGGREGEILADLDRG